MIKYPGWQVEWQPIIRFFSDGFRRLSPEAKSSQYIGALHCPSQRIVRNPHIDLGRPETGVSEQGLDRPDVDAFLDQQCCGGVPEPVRGQVRLDVEALGQRPQPLTERGRAKSATFRVQKQGCCDGAFPASHLGMSPYVLLQLMVRHEDDPLLVTFSSDENLASVLRHVADSYIGQLADPQPGYDEQFDDQDCDGILLDRCRIVRA